MTENPNPICEGGSKVNELQEQIRAVAQAREHTAFLISLKRLRLDEWEQEHAGLLKDLADNVLTLAEAEAKLRESTLTAYQETGEKQPAPGVSVKMFQTLDYDPQRAYRWACEHKIALSLDKKAFESFAKTSFTPLDFVAINEEARAQIASDLSEYLVTEEKTC